MDPPSNRIRSQTQAPSFDEAVLKKKIALICNHVGYHAITQDSTNILVDIYRRTFIHLARHCKEAANNNRRVETTMTDLIQAYDFVGISIPELKEHIETVKIPFTFEILKEEELLSNRIQRNLLVDDLLEAEKHTQNEDQDDLEGSENNDANEGIEDKPTIPLLKEAYEEISRNFPNPSVPTKADKKIRPGENKPKPEIKIKKEDKPAIPPLKVSHKADKISLKLKAPKTKRTPVKAQRMSKKKKLKLLVKGTQPKIIPLDPAIAEPPSFLPILQSIKQEVEPAPPEVVAIPSAQPITVPTPPPVVIPPVVQQTTASKTATPPPSKKSRTPPPAKMPKVKKRKKKTSNQFAIEVERETVKAAPVADAPEEKEWICPGCGAPDDGDIMVECDLCQLWYHLRCTSLKKPPKDDDTWECDKCLAIKQAVSSKQAALSKQATTSKQVVARKRPVTPAEAPPAVVVKPDAKPILKLEPQPIVSDPPPATQVVPSVPVEDNDNCPECHLPDDGTLMIQCDDPFCAKWFHGKCVNVLEEPKDDESWFCKACVEKQQSAFKRRRRAK